MVCMMNGTLDNIVILDSEWFMRTDNDPLVNINGVVEPVKRIRTFPAIEIDLTYGTIVLSNKLFDAIIQARNNTQKVFENGE